MSRAKAACPRGERSRQLPASIMEGFESTAAGVACKHVFVWWDDAVTAPEEQNDVDDDDEEVGRPLPQTDEGRAKAAAELISKQAEMINFIILVVLL